MLWYCHYRANEGVRNADLMKRFGEPEGDDNFEMFKGIRAWYAFAGLTEGVVMMEVDTPMELTGILQPCRHLVSWTVHAVQEMEMEPHMKLMR